MKRWQDEFAEHKEKYRKRQYGRTDHEAARAYSRKGWGACKDRAEWEDSLRWKGGAA